MRFARLLRRNGEHIVCLLDFLSCTVRLVSMVPGGELRTTYLVCIGDDRALHAKHLWNWLEWPTALQYIKRCKPNAAGLYIVEIPAQ